MAVVLKLSVSKATPLLRGQDHYWRVMRAMDAAGGSFTVSQVRAVSDDRDTAAIRAFVQRLVKGGIAEDTGQLAGTPIGRDERIYRLLRRPDATPVLSRDGAVMRSSSGQQQMWNVMRGPLARGGFTAADLVTYGSTEHMPVPLASAKTYIQNLHRGGYLVQLDPGGPGRLATWRLKPSRNTGPAAPKVLQAKLVWDANAERLAGEIIAEEIAP